MSIRDAFQSLLTDSDTIHVGMAPSSQWGRFATLLMMHVVTVQVGQASEAARSWLGRSDGVTAAPEKSSITIFEQVKPTLNNCRSLAVASGSMRADVRTERGDSLLFNAVSVLRLCYGQALPLAAERSSLLRCEDAVLDSALRKFVGVEQARNNFITQTISWTFEGLCIPVRKGVLLVRKTAALTWSMEHALAGWDTGMCMHPTDGVRSGAVLADIEAALIIAKWIHSVERARRVDGAVGQDELELFNHMARFLGRVEAQSHPPVSVAANISRFWAGFYEDTWVWGGMCDTCAWEHIHLLYPLLLRLIEEPC